MFGVAEQFNQAVNFDTSKVTSMNVRTPDRRWHVHARECLRCVRPLVSGRCGVVDASRGRCCCVSTCHCWYERAALPRPLQYMFFGAWQFNQAVNFDTSEVTNMRERGKLHRSESGENEGGGGVLGLRRG